jgi:hypothetical protein
MLSAMTRKIRESKPFAFPTYDLDSLRSRPLPTNDAEELLALAGSPDTDPKTLLTIWLKSCCPSVKHTLARNPSTPVSALLRLWALDPGAVLENPVVLLWEFTKPGSPQKILPPSIQYSLYQFLLDRPEFEQHRSYISEDEVVRMLGKKDGYRLKVPAHIVVRDERSSIRLVLLELTVQFQSEKLGRPVEFPATALNTLAADSSKPVLHALAVAMANRWILPEPFAPDFIFRLARHLHAKGEASIAHPIAQWPFLDSELVEHLAMGADDELIAVLAKHPNASQQFQSRMATHNSALIRASVASSTRDEALLRRLFSDRDPLVRCGLASSPHLPSDLQWPLFKSKDSRILLALLKNPITTPEILEQLAGLPNLGITRLLREHPNTPAHIREALPKPY